MQLHNGPCRATWAATAPNPNVKIFLGVPASPKAAGSGYQTFSQLTAVIDSIKNSPAFGGVMMYVGVLLNLSHVLHHTHTLLTGGTHPTAM